MARRFLVSGRVQRVGFRWFVVEEASRRGLTGWVRNLPDGRVEVLAQGEPGPLDELERALAQGPHAARVVGVVSSDAVVDGKRTHFDVAP